MSITRVKKIAASILTVLVGLSGCGGSGDNGSDGLNTLVKVSAEPASANCASGGSKIESGPDASRNNVLEASEVSNTSYFCSESDVAWVEATGDMQARSNTGYVANGTSRITITLPTNPAVGEITRVSGVGVGGWRIAQNGFRLSVDTARVGPRFLVRSCVLGRWNPASGSGVRWSALYLQRCGRHLDGTRVGPAMEFGCFVRGRNAAGRCGPGWAALHLH